MVQMRKRIRVAAIVGTMPAAAVLLLSHPAGASPRMVSLALSSQLNNPQQIGADAFRDKLLASPGKRFVVDQRVGTAIGSENTILTAARSGAVDVAVISGGVVSAVVPGMSVFDVPFLFRDVAHAKAVMQGPVGAKIGAQFADKGLVLLAFGKQGFRNVTNSLRLFCLLVVFLGFWFRVFLFV